MGFFKWYEKQVRKLTEKSMNLIILGTLLVILSLGSMFSIELIRYAYFILIISFLILINYVNKNFISWYKKEKIEISSHFFGMLGLFLLVLVFGIQSPQIPFKFVILIIGILLTLPALADYIKNR